MPQRKKLSLDEAATKLTEIAERALAKLPEEERDARVEAFGRRSFTGAHEKRAKSSRTARTRRSQAAGRGR